MDSEESDEIPMLLTSSQTADHILIELSEFHSPPPKQANSNHPTYFSAPLQPSSNKNRYASRPVQGNRTNKPTEEKDSTFKRHKRFFSGPVIVQNEAAAIAPLEVKGALRRRPQSVAPHEHLLRSGSLGKCDDPFCTTCPLYPRKEELDMWSPLHHKLVAGQANGKANNRIKQFFKLAHAWGLAFIPGVMHPHTKKLQKWNKFFLISCLLAAFVDPLFFFILSVDKKLWIMLKYMTSVYLDACRLTFMFIYKPDNHCIYFDVKFAKVITVLRSAADLVYIIHMLLQFRLAYFGPSSGIGSGPLIDEPKQIVGHYLLGWFFLDLVVVLPLPQIIMWVIMPKALGMTYAATFTKNLLRVIILIQYIPRMSRFTPLLAGHSPTGFIFETAQANFFINLFLFLLVAHVVGSCWYLFGLQRVNQCLHNACHNSSAAVCDFKFLDCGEGIDVNIRMNKINEKLWGEWRVNANATRCFYQNSDVFKFGIYSTAVNVTVSTSYVQKYVYSLFWGFQQISTLAANQMPSMFVGEILFVLGIVVLGLLLTVLLIGNMQNFLLALSRRGVEMQLRRHDVETWMSRRGLPIEFRRKVLEAERFRWAANRGVNEEELLKSLPEDIEKEIRKSLCLDLIKKVRLFTFMEQQVLDAICERLRQNLYIQGSIILTKNCVIEKMHFFIKGDVEVEENGVFQQLLHGFCGEELLIWCLENESRKSRGGVERQWPMLGRHAVSSTTVRCAGNVEAFSLTAKDLHEVIHLYNQFLLKNEVQRAIRYESSYVRTRAATRIQVAWRKRKHSQQNSFSYGWRPLPFS